MKLREWMDAHHPGRGGTGWLVRTAPSSYQTVNKALRGDAIDDKPAAERISAATGGEVSVAELMGLSEHELAESA